MSTLCGAQAGGMCELQGIAQCSYLMQYRCYPLSNELSGCFYLATFPDISLVHCLSICTVSLQTQCSRGHLSPSVVSPKQPTSMFFPGSGMGVSCSSSCTGAWSFELLLLLLTKDDPPVEVSAGSFWCRTLKSQGSFLHCFFWCFMQFHGLQHGFNTLGCRCFFKRLMA